jgi:hypothetical protein
VPPDGVHDATASITEKLTTLTFFATDETGNAETRQGADN